MGKVFVYLGLSLDGFIAGPNRGPKNPLGDGGANIHAWMFQQRSFRELLKLGHDGDTGPENDIIESVIQRIGANIMGKRMFEEGEAHWPEEAPFHRPVFVHTHERRSPWERKGGTTFYFTNDPPERVLEKAREVAGDKDVRIAGGADIVQQYLNAGLVDEVMLAHVPTLLGAGDAGVRLFDRVDPSKVQLEIVATSSSPLVTHVTYAVSKPGSSPRK